MGRPSAGTAEDLIDLRAHFAREIHDQIAQPLTGLMLEIGQLRERERAVEAKDLVRIEETARQVLRQAREMLIDLRGHGELRVNFVQALKNGLPVGAGRLSTLQVSTRWPRRLNGWAAFNLLRIVQQAVTNAQRHGRAQKVDILLDLEPEGDAVLVVLDDGVGIDAAAQGYGMVGMRERTEILGGIFSVQPRETGGTRIEVRVPRQHLV